MEAKTVVTGEDGNRLFDDYLSTINDRIIKLEKQMEELKSAKL